MTVIIIDYYSTQFSEGLNYNRCKERRRALRTYSDYLKNAKNGRKSWSVVIFTNESLYYYRRRNFWTPVAT